MSYSDYDQWVEEHYKQGYGSGRYENYKSWLEQTSFSSSGYTTIARGITVDRNYIFFSDLEKMAFRIVDFQNNTIDILEQVPLLDRHLSAKIAQELNVKHPKFKNSDVDIVMTTDLLVYYLADGIEKQVAYTVKPSQELEKRRVIEKLSIERAYFLEKGVTDYRILTEKDIDAVKARNIENLLNFKNLDELPNLENFNSDERKELSEEMKRQILQWQGSPRELSKYFEDQFSLPYGTGLPLIKNLIFNKQIIIDLDQPINFEKRWKIL